MSDAIDIPLTPNKGRKERMKTIQRIERLKEVVIIPGFL
jgi:hypothetical protein